MLYWFISLNMPKVNCAVVGCSSSTYGINKWKKEPCLEHGDKNVVKGQCPKCERHYSLYCFPVEMTKNKGFRISNEETQTEWNGPQNVVIVFVYYIL